MSVPSQRAYDLQHNKNIDKYSKRIRYAYLKMIRRVSKLAVPLSLNSSNEFYFRNNSRVSKQVDKLLKELYSNVYVTTVEGINSEWEFAVKKNNELAYYVYGKSLEELPNQYKSKYFSNNADARKAFVKRKIDGLNLSDRVWKNTKQLKTELELALETGIGRGKSADSIARKITDYLNEPDKLFRRIKDENGVLRLSKAAKSYNPGRGVYRSSYKNVNRLARNEINASYESSQKEKREQQDFIVGIKIKVSPSHNPSDDKGGISCIALQGKYPKDFDFTYKWHVNCKCTSFNILKTREELDSDLNLILSGKKPNTKSKRQINKIPNNYNDYSKNTKIKTWTFENNK